MSRERILMVSPVKETAVKNYEPVMSFDDVVAEIYDDKAVHAGGDPGVPAVGDVPATVAFLAALAHGGPALELAIGTGRIALPLSACGITVDGMGPAPRPRLERVVLCDQGPDSIHLR
jgi:hypothetical protein